MGTWLSKGNTPHYCNVPGWRHRRREGAKLGAVWICSCGQAWQFQRDMMFGGDEWVSLTRKELDDLKLPIMQPPPPPPV